MFFGVMRVVYKRLFSAVTAHANTTFLPRVGGIAANQLLNPTSRTRAVID
jgi:hypothetical protein